MGEAKRRRAIHADDEATPLSLADRIFAQCGSRADAMHLGRSFTFLHKAISLAQRFNLDLDVVHACHELKQSKPSSLVAALPLCRLPYPRMWVEWTGTVKWRCGVLIESLNGNPTTGLITHVYDGGDCPVINPWATYFDWRTDGDVSALAKKTASGFMPAGGICLKTSTSPEAASNVMAITEGWEKFSANENEAKSLYDFLKHLELGLSPYMWSRFKT